MPKLVDFAFMILTLIVLAGCLLEDRKVIKNRRSGLATPAI